MCSWDALKGGGGGESSILGGSPWDRCGSALASSENVSDLATAICVLQTERKALPKQEPSLERKGTMCVCGCLTVERLRAGCGFPGNASVCMSVAGSYVRICGAKTKGRGPGGGE